MRASKGVHVTAQAVEAVFVRPGREDYGGSGCSFHCRMGGARLFKVKHREWTRDCLKVVTRKILMGGKRENIFITRMVKHWEKTAQRGCRMTIPGDFAWSSEEIPDQSELM